MTGLPGYFRLSDVLHVISHDRFESNPHTTHDMHYLMSLYLYDS